MAGLAETAGIDVTFVIGTATGWPGFIVPYQFQHGATRVNNPASENVLGPSGCVLLAGLG